MRKYQISCANLNSARWKVCLFVILTATCSLRAQNTTSDTIILIQNVSIFDGEHEKINVGDVLIEGDKIKQVSSSSISTPSGATIIDGTGHTLMPGLIDVHWHTSYAYMEASMLLTGDISDIGEPFT